MDGKYTFGVTVRLRVFWIGGCVSRVRTCAAMVPSSELLMDLPMHPVPDLNQFAEGVAAQS